MTAIVRNPGIQGGEPIFRGTRIPVKALFDYLEGGQTINEFVDDFEGMTLELALMALQEAQQHI